MARDFLTPPNLKAPLQVNGATGTNGQVLTSQGASNPPQWQTPSSGGSTSAGANLYLNANFI